MKRICLIRHAKSSWANPSLKDIERPLKKRGFSDAQLIGEYLKRRKIELDLALCSPAMRAKQTAENVLTHLNSNSIIKFHNNFYFQGANEIISQFRKQDDNINCIAFFGHNPDMEVLVETLTEASIYHIPTCGTYVLDFKIKSWKDLEQKKGEVFLAITPKMLKVKKS